jgi:hypothetical protein
MASSTISLAGFDQARALFGDLITERAATSAINKIAAQTKTQISREIRQVFNVKAAAVKDAITVRRARIGGTEAFVIGTGARIPLKYFDAKKNARGIITTKVRKAGGRKPWPHAFFIASIGDNVFTRQDVPKRLTTRGRYAGTGIKRQPIKKRFSVSIPQMIGNDEVVQRILANAQAIAPGIFQHEVEFYVSRYGR